MVKVQGQNNICLFIKNVIIMHGNEGARERKRKQAIAKCFICQEFFSQKYVAEIAHCSVHDGNHSCVPFVVTNVHSFI